MEILQNIGFDWQVALANFVSFLLIFFILKKWVFGPVGEMLERRKELFAEGVNKAERSEEALQEAQNQAEKTIKEARKDANEIVAQAKQRGDELVEKATRTAQEEAEKVSLRAQASLEQERELIERELLSKTASLVSLGVEKILKEEVDTGRNEKLTKRALDILEKQ